MYVKGMTPVCLWMLLACLLPMGGSDAYGRVFWKWGTGSGAFVRAEEPGWAQAYHTTLRLNGGGGRFDMMQSDRDLASTVARLRVSAQQQGGRAYFFTGETMAWGFVLLPGRVIRVLAFLLDNPGVSMVALLDQSHEDFKNSFRPPAQHQLRDLPVVPGSSPTYFAADENTHTAVEVSTANTAPIDAKRFLESELLANGWKTALPPSPGGEASAGLTVYLKGREICLVSVNPSGVLRESVITMVHKRLGVSERPR